MTMLQKSCSVITVICSSQRIECMFTLGWPELKPAILDWYGHCGDRQAMHKCQQAIVGSAWGHAAPGKFLKLGTWRLLFKVMFRPRCY